jgi:hypothetical protein
MDTEIDATFTATAAGVKPNTVKLAVHQNPWLRISHLNDLTGSGKIMGTNDPDRVFVHVG